ncbi:MAG TPA: hypothetical protein PKD90_12605, partial [Phnomibacter sp.]|nr:hypothetical protein [Phnomibacter sp.]
PAIRHALEQLAATAENYDAICLLQPTSPFRKKGFIDAAIETFQQQQTDSLISVLPVPHEYNPHWVFVPDSHNKLVIATGEKSIITRRQELPPAFIRDGSLYLAKTAVIMQQNSLYGNTIGYVVNDKEFYVNIDTPADWELAEQWIANRAHTYET